MKSFHLFSFKHFSAGFALLLTTFCLAQTTVEVINSSPGDIARVMQPHEKGFAIGAGGKQYLLIHFRGSGNTYGGLEIHESLDAGATWSLKTTIPWYGGTITYNPWGSMVMASDQITLHVTWSGIPTYASGYQPYSIYYATYNTQTNTWSTIEKLFNGTATNRFMNTPDIDLYGPDLPVIIYTGKNTSWTSYMNYKTNSTTWAFPLHPGTILSSSDFFNTRSVTVDFNDDFIITGRVRATQCGSWKNNMYWRFWDQSGSVWGNSDQLIHPWTANHQSAVMDDSGNLFVAFVAERTASCAVKNGLYVAMKPNGVPSWTSYYVDAAGGGYGNGTSVYNFGVTNNNGQITVVWSDNGAYPTIYKADWNGSGFNAKQTIVNPGGESYRFINTYKKENNNYSCLLFDYTDQSSDPMDVWVYNCSIPLPIQLLGFSAKTEQNVVRLLWSTASELNNVYFNIERSSNGMDFKSIAQIDGQINSDQVVHYNYTDKHPANGMNYYRLKQTDMDGQSKYSDVIAVLFRKSDVGISNIYPVPTNDNLNIKITSDQDKTVDLFIYDAAGNEVLAEREMLNSGTNIITLDISALAKGLYHMAIKDDSGFASVPRASTRFAKQ